MNIADIASVFSDPPAASSPMTPGPSGLRVGYRKLIPSDRAAVCRLYLDGPTRDRVPALYGDIQHAIGAYRHIGWAAIESTEGTWVGGAMIGYALVELREESVKIVSMAVAPGRRRAGIGRALVGEAMSKVEDREGGRSTCEALVPETARAACELFAGLGFASRLVRAGSVGCPANGIWGVDWVRFERRAVGRGGQGVQESRGGTRGVGGED